MGNLAWVIPLFVNLPILHEEIKNVKKAVTSCGYQVDDKGPAGHGLVLLRDGTIWTTGHNEFGQLGVNDTKTRLSFSQINHSASFRDIFCGDGHYASCGAITDNNELYVWGYNAHGQLGTGNTDHQHLPIKPDTTFQGNVNKAVFGGGTNYEGCIVQTRNGLYAAGYSEFGNLGINSQEKNKSHF